MASKPKHYTQDMVHGKFAKTTVSDVRRSGLIISRLSGLITLPVGQEDVIVLAIKKKECQEKK
jgi:hypothetical protein